jgi:hypothetical protein
VVLLPFDQSVAITWGQLQARAQRRGRPRPVNDTWIAACCLVDQLPHSSARRVAARYPLPPPGAAQATRHHRNLIMGTTLMGHLSPKIGLVCAGHGRLGDSGDNGEILVARGGVEPPTFRFSGGRSYQLSYLAMCSTYGTCRAWRS